MASLNKESSLVTVSETEIGAGDYVRVLDGNSSRKITCTDFADVMSPLLQTIGFLTASAPTSSTEFHKITKILTNYNVISTDSVILCNTSAGVLGVNLPTALSAWDATLGVGQHFTIKRTTTDLNKVTVTPSGIETIDGDTAYDLVGPNLVSISVVSDGTNWHIVG